MRPAVGGLVTGILAVGAIYFLKTGGVTGGGYDVLSVALSGSLAFKVMGVLCILKIGATVFSYSSGGAGGIFAPALFIGGMLGGVFGILDVNLLNPGGNAANEIGAFALVGMGAVFAGIVRAPITSVLIIFEMTGSYGLILPLMITNMTAYGLARHFRPVPIYEALLEQDDIHMPHGRRGISHALERIYVRDVFRTDAVILDSNLTVAQAVKHVQKYEFTTFPVVDQSDQCVGVITEMRLRRNLAAGGAETPISEIADKCRSIYPDELLNAAVVKMNNSKIRQLAVIEHGNEQKFLGILTMTDIVRAQAEAIGNADRD